MSGHTSSLPGCSCSSDLSFSLPENSYYQREARALIRPSLLPGPPSNSDIAKLPGNSPKNRLPANTRLECWGIAWLGVLMH